MVNRVVRAPEYGRNHPWVVVRLSAHQHSRVRTQTTNRLLTHFRCEPGDDNGLIAENARAIPVIAKHQRRLLLKTLPARKRLHELDETVAVVEQVHASGLYVRAGACERSSIGWVARCYTRRRCRISTRWDTGGSQSRCFARPLRTSPTSGCRRPIASRPVLSFGAAGTCSCGRPCSDCRPRASAGEAVFRATTRSRLRLRYPPGYRRDRDAEHPPRGLTPLRLSRPSSTSRRAVGSSSLVWIELVEWRPQWRRHQNAARNVGRSRRGSTAFARRSKRQLERRFPNRRSSSELPARTGIAGLPATKRRNRQIETLTSGRAAPLHPSGFRLITHHSRIAVRAESRAGVRLAGALARLRGPGRVRGRVAPRTFTRRPASKRATANPRAPHLERHARATPLTSGKGRYTTRD